jgi:hypothetical protein
MRFAALVVLCVGCQGNVATPFPTGLEPLEDNPVPATGPRDETLVAQTSDSDFIRVYARGYVLVAPAIVWAAVKQPSTDIAVCSTDQQMVTPDNEPQYEASFLVHYIVNNILTVEWDDQWRCGTIEGTPDAPTLGMVKHQKTQGSTFITLSEGTIQVLATDDPQVTELSFVEHLDATSASTDQVLAGTQHTYAAIVAVSHGNPIPACP